MPTRKTLRGGRPAMTGSQRIGWDPLAKKIHSWVFDSEGGLAEGVWTRDGNRWIVKLSGVTRDGKPAPLLSTDTWAVIEKNKEVLDSAIIYNRDFNFQYFGFKTLERSYLLKLHGVPAERPQHMFMRVSLGIHGDNIPAAIEVRSLLMVRCMYVSLTSPTRRTT